MKPKFLALLLLLSPMARGEEKPAPEKKSRIPQVTVEIETKNEMASPLPGALVELDGKTVGVSDDLGRLSVKTNPGSHKVFAHIPGSFRGEAKLELDRPGQMLARVEVLLDEPDLELDWQPQRVSSILNEKLTTVKIFLRDHSGREIRVQDVAELRLEDRATGRSYDLRDYFAKSKGTLELLEPGREPLQRILREVRSEVRLYFSGTTSNYLKRHVVSERSFFVGRRHLQIQLKSAGKGDRPIGYANLRLTFHPERATDIPPVSIVVTADKDGKARLSGLPIGFYSISHEGGPPHDLWARDWRIQLQSDLIVDLKPERLSDIRAGKVSVEARRFPNP